MHIKLYSRSKQFLDHVGRGSSSLASHGEKPLSGRHDDEKSSNGEHDQSKRSRDLVFDMGLRFNFPSMDSSNF